MLVADHSSAVKRSSESRTMPETEKPPAKPVDIYLIASYKQWEYTDREKGVGTWH